MVDVVIPLCVLCARLASIRSLKIMRLVAIVFQYEMDMSIRLDGAANHFRQFCENVGSGVVKDRIHRVQTQTVKMVLGQPIQGVVNEEVPNGPAFCSIEVDGIAPWRMMTIGEKLRSVKAEIISFRTKVVVDDVQENHHAAAVSRLNQFLKIFRAAIGGIGCERIDAVVSPI